MGPNGHAHQTQGRKLYHHAGIRSDPSIKRQVRASSNLVNANQESYQKAFVWFFRTCNSARYAWNERRFAMYIRFLHIKCFYNNIKRASDLLWKILILASDFIENYSGFESKIRALINVGASLTRTGCIAQCVFTIRRRRWSWQQTCCHVWGSYPGHWFVPTTQRPFRASARCVRCWNARQKRNI